MKSKLRHILLTSCLIIGLPITLIYGQDSGSPSFEAYESEVDHERERVMYSPGEGSTDPVSSRSSQQSITVRDSASFKSAAPLRNIKPAIAPAKVSNKPKGEDDSILSFNFLYYIIEKYKLQDIVED
jgi:hypothetical protein